MRGQDSRQRREAAFHNLANLKLVSVYRTTSREDFARPAVGLFIVTKRQQKLYFMQVPSLLYNLLLFFTYI